MKIYHALSVLYIIHFSSYIIQGHFFVYQANLSSFPLIQKKKKKKNSKNPKFNEISIFVHKHNNHIQQTRSQNL